MVVVSCERGDIRNAKHGLYLYGDDGLQEMELKTDSALYRGDLEELHAAVVLGRPVFHSGEWGLATVEATLGILQSARERREIRLSRQVAMPAQYDADGWDCQAS
jgi:phthalate 4,5-cis-dihydrodiol dehydrogenase